MEEDVAGTQEELIGEKYTICSRCGRPVPRSETTLIRRTEGDETRSDQEEICAKCKWELEHGAKWDTSVE